MRGNQESYNIILSLNKALKNNNNNNNTRLQRLPWLHSCAAQHAGSEAALYDWGIPPGDVGGVAWEGEPR